MSNNNVNYRYIKKMYNTMKKKLDIKSLFVLFEANNNLLFDYKYRELREVKKKNILKVRK